jgi:hypothetical protein
VFSSLALEDPVFRVYITIQTRKINHKYKMSKQIVKAKKVKKHPQVLHIRSPQFLHALGILSTRRALCDEKEVDLMRNMARGMFDGDREYKFLIGGSGTVNANSTLGTISITQLMYSEITSCANWTGLAAIFDEFAFLRVKHQFVPYSAGFNTSSPQPTTIAYDDDGASSAPTSYNTVLAYPTARVFCPALQGATLATEANSTGFYPLETHHTRPYPLGPGPVVNASTTGWVDIATPSDMLGNWIMYNASVSTSNNATCYSYFFRYECAFRCVR